MSDHKANTVPEHRVTVAEILGLLVDDGLVLKPDADVLIAESRLRRQVAHPLTIIAEQKWKSQLPPHRPLALQAGTPAARPGAETPVTRRTGRWAVRHRGRQPMECARVFPWRQFLRHIDDLEQWSCQQRRASYPLHR